MLYHQPTDISSKSHPSSSAPDTPCPPPSHRMPSLPSSPTCMRGCGPRTPEVLFGFWLSRSPGQAGENHLLLQAVGGGTAPPQAPRLPLSHQTTYKTQTRQNLSTSCDSDNSSHVVGCIKVQTYYNLMFLLSYITILFIPNITFY